MLELKSVTKVFSSLNGDSIMAVDEVTLDIREKELICLVGRSGCGKTTTLRLIAGLETPTQGAIFLDGEPIQAPGADRSVVFQKYTLFPWRTVLSNVAFGLENSGLSKKERKSMAMHYLELVGLKNQARAYPNELSGGMQQRVAVARAMAPKPRVLLMDEPFGALDAQTRGVLQQELIRIRKTESNTIVFVTHDIQEAVLLADRVVVMHGPPGRIQAILDCDLPRPRDKNSRECMELSDRIHALLESPD